ncbi:glycosyltransferase [Glycomyces harbinensis]|uniref:Glycosyltransferase involved in cell wall bisynthesis n=1 Tax=Glycomyces harbinensis TaxID=58114 RepID=A0A1G7CNM5_9ACTN|nr:glycosyltransferase [Glycomyces harbinensis]SDE40932.1 Glycosyltransferase involved in cell wall bisynthesis [Glycomyces harbinensis]
MTAHSRSQQLQVFLDRHRAVLDQAPPSSIAAAAVRGNSPIGRGALAARALAGVIDPAELLSATGHLDAEALCELARVLAVRPAEPGDRELALALYDRASEGTALPGSHRALHLSLAVWDGEPGRIARLRAHADRLPDRFAAAVDAELAHPAHGGGEAAFLDAFARYADWTDIALDHHHDPALPMLDRLRSTAPAGSVNGPLVSIIMTCHRPGPELLTAVRSVVEQTWRDWELLLVDDASGPDFEKVLRAAAELDPRVDVRALPANGGTYRARNLALAAAAGTFTTGLDSDDWAHPRWLEAQAAPLLAADETVMAMSRGIRADADLRLFGAPGRGLTEARSTSIMFRTEPVRSRLGGYDTARKGGDSEFRLRIQKAFGSRRWVRMEANHTVVRRRSGSLSLGEVGDGWMHPARAAYEAGFHHWHKAIQQKLAKPRLDPASRARPFPAPKSILGEATRPRRVARVHVADWRYDTPVQRAALAELARDVASGAAVAVAHYQSWDSIEDKYLPMAQAPLAKAAALGVEWVDLAEIEAEGTVAADESVAEAIAVDFADAAIGPIRVLPRPADEPEAPAPNLGAVERLRPLAGKTVQLPKRVARKILRGKRSALRRMAGRARRFAKRLLGRPGPHALTEAQGRSLQLWRTRLHEGWSTEATAYLRGLTADERESPEHRLGAAAILADWYELDDKVVRRELELDVVVVSNFMLPGGSSSSSAEEVRALRRAGMRVGLVHHPVYDWPLDRPLNDKIRELLDDEGVVWITARDRVECDLAIVRFPRIMMRPMDDLPSLNARRTILVVNQPPYEYYGPGAGRRLTWDVRTVHRNLAAWLGDHTWYPQGPVVRQVLENEHAAETEGVDIAADYWYGVLDVDEWRREGRRPGSGPIRIGRHARDHVRKWPETPERILAAYPTSDDFEIHVLGGAKAVRGMLRRLPENWTILPFGSMQPKEFLHRMDVVVFFIAEAGDEAFGRTPLEAMAVGLPCLLPRSFEPLFGDGAVYCEPEEVEARVRELMDDPDLYAAQSARAIEKVERDFSHRALLRRAAGLGVAIPTGAQR